MDKSISGDQYSKRATHPFRVHILQFQPGTGRHLWGEVGLVLVVGLVEAQDDLVLLRHLVGDVVVPGSVLLMVAPHHGDEDLVCWGRTTGAGAAAAVVLNWALLVVGSDVPVIPPAIQVTLC